MWTPWKAKLPLLPFNRHPNQEQSKRMRPKKGHFLFSSQSRASYSQPHCKKQARESTLLTIGRTAILRIDLLLLVHIVYSRTKINVATAVGFFFTYKTLRKSGVEKGHSNYSQKHNNVRNVIRYERDSEGVEISLCCDTQLDKRQVF